MLGRSYLQIAMLLILGADATSALGAGPDAGGRKGRHPDPLGAISRCRAGLEQLNTTEPGDRSASLARACSEIFVEPACRDALQHLDSIEPAQRATTLASRCRAAYCPLLPEPRPELCGPDFEHASPSTLLPQWKAFSAAVLSYDFGPLAEPAGLLLYNLLGSSVAIRVDAPPPPERTDLALTLLARPAGKRLLVVLTLPSGKEQSLRMAPEPTPAELAQLAAALHGLLPSTRATLQMDRSLRYGTVMAFMDTLRSAGLTRFAFSVTAR